MGVIKGLKTFIKSSYTYLLVIDNLIKLILMITLFRFLMVKGKVTQQQLVLQLGEVTPPVWQRLNLLSVKISLHSNKVN